MRTRTQQDIALAAHPSQGFRTWIKVEMTRASAHAWGSETWVDLTDLNGFDWVKGVEYGESLDTPAWTATVRLHSHLTDNPLFSLSPFLANSVNNIGGVLIQPYRKIRISTGIVPMGDPRSSATFNIVFLGRVSSYTMRDGEIALQCLDRTSELQAFFIEAEREYGASDPTTATAEDVEEIIQNILDDHYNTNTTISGTASAARTDALASRTTDGSPYQLYSSGGDSTTPFNITTDFAIREYTQSKMQVWQACQALADTIGYQLRMRWHEGSGVDDFVLVLEEPDRAKSTADFTLDPTLGQCHIETVELSSADVRNVVRVGYADSGTNYTFSEDNDASSIAKYGRKFMEIQEASTSQIDTSAEAVKMRDAALKDLKEPTAKVSITAPYVWYAQLNDLVAIEADNFFFDTQNKLAILSRRNVIQQGGVALTSFQLEGLPKAKKSTLLQMQRSYRHQRGVTAKFSQSLRGGRLSNFSFASRTRE